LANIQNDVVCFREIIRTILKNEANNRSEDKDSSGRGVCTAAVLFICGYFAEAGVLRIQAGSWKGCVRETKQARRLMVQAKTQTPDASAR
jgi:hypothetical protein